MHFLRNSYAGIFYKELKVIPGQGITKSYFPFLSKFQCISNKIDKDLHQFYRVSIYQSQIIGQCRMDN